MKTYTYIDNSKNVFPKGGEILFSCPANSIVEADKLFEKSTNIEAIFKKPHISTTV
jgi:hypothetical protein